MLFRSGVALGALAVHRAPLGLAGVGWRFASLVLFALLAWKSDVWKDRGAIRHRPAAS